MISTFRERTDKPHIFFRDGYWRVNLSRGGVHNRLKPWHKAHEFIRPWNIFSNRQARLCYPFEPVGKCGCGPFEYCEGCIGDNGRSDARVGSAEGVSQQTTWVHRAADSDGCD